MYLNKIKNKTSQKIRGIYNEYLMSNISEKSVLLENIEIRVFFIVIVKI